MHDTIFALSSGAPPAAIAVIRISGPKAGEALFRLAGRLPEPRRTAYLRLRDAGGETLDHALVLWLPGPGTATGEDIAELHCHGGRAVVAAIEAELAQVPKLRRATPGEFTRRAFANGRIDLAEAEGLADLLSAETELQRRSALAVAGGSLSRQVEEWRAHLLAASAAVEAVLDFADEDDVSVLPPEFTNQIDYLRSDIADWLRRPRAEALREGFRVVLAGPPNAGKSSLFNVLVDSEAAITAPIAGTTRDVLTRPVSMEGIPFLFADTAGLRDEAGDAIEIIGVERARSELDRADLVLWLGPEGEGPAGAWELEPQADRDNHIAKRNPRHKVSAVSGEGIAALQSDLVAAARDAMPKPGDAALNARQHRLLSDTEATLAAATRVGDPLLLAEHLRLARFSFDALLGRTTTEDMLDTLFGRFCIGK
ncbi:MAG: tRNA uridine-5-carboxymethylaminomethyl(34) synthesis GTPase MnmE [Novosphingobium sp.]